jgi:hypothetical protein
VHKAMVIVTGDWQYAKGNYLVFFSIKVWGTETRPKWPVFVLRTPKGWRGTKGSTVCRSRAAFARTRFQLRISLQTGSVTGSRSRSSVRSSARAFSQSAVSSAEPNVSGRTARLAL